VQRPQCSLYGFVRNEFFYDTRLSLVSAAGLLYLVPLDKKLNEEHVDLNAQPSSRLLSIGSRIGLRISGIDTWNAKVSARLEADFDGFSIAGSNYTSNTLLRIRQAWVKMEWQKLDIQVGQTWHPMFGAVVPSVLGLSAGAPFQPLNRSPQVRVDYKMKDFKLYSAAVYQMQNLSVGPRGASPEYLRDNILPELYVGFDYTPQSWIAGAGFDVIRLRPRIVGEKEMLIDGKQTLIPCKVSDNITSFSANAFVQYSAQKLRIKAKYIYGQNMAHLLLLSGYGISEKNDDGSFEYSNVAVATSWLNITYGETYQAGLFMGYSKNYGSSKALVEMPYTFGPNNFEHVYRIAPQFLYSTKQWNIGLEYELTNAAYGTFVLSKGKVSDTHNVLNHRIFAEIVYYF
jgi:hypothetical protein